MATATAVPQDDQAWDEAQCAAALASLEKMQDQLDEIRLSIPDLVEPLKVPHATPADLFRDFKQTAVEVNKRMQNFNLAWKAQETQNIFSHARQRQQAEPDLTQGYGLSRYGWLDNIAKEQKSQSAARVKEASHSANIGENFKAADVVPTVNAFAQAHPDFKVVIQDDRAITVLMTVPSLILKFIIVSMIDSEGNAIFHVDCPGTIPIFPAITRCIASRPQPNDLDYLLQMIAAYTDLRDAKCAKCGKFLDDKALSSAGRRKKQSKDSDGNEHEIWQSFHEGCL